MHHTCDVQQHRGMMGGHRPAERQSVLTTGLHPGHFKPPPPPSRKTGNKLIIYDRTHTPQIIQTYIAFVLNGIKHLIILLLFSHRSAFPSLSLFFHSPPHRQVLNDTAELTGCYGNRLVIRQEEWGRVWHDCGWGHVVLVAGWMGWLLGGQWVTHLYRKEPSLLGSRMQWHSSSLCSEAHITLDVKAFIQFPVISSFFLWARGFYTTGICCLSSWLSEKGHSREASCTPLRGETRVCAAR